MHRKVHHWVVDQNFELSWY